MNGGGWMSASAVEEVDESGDKWILVGYVDESREK